MSGIGVLREGPLHAAVKAAIARPGDRMEVPVAGFVIDLVRGDGELVEVQTGGFAALGRKLDALLDDHRVRIVYPVAAERQIVRVDADGQVLSSRRSPRRATALEVFDKLVSFPSLLSHPHLTVEVLLLQESHVRAAEAQTVRGRRKDPGQRRMLGIAGRVVFASSADVLAFLPPLPAEPFSTRQLAEAVGCRILLAQRIAYCLRGMEVLEAAGKQGRAPLYRTTVPVASGASRRRENVR